MGRRKLPLVTLMLISISAAIGFARAQDGSPQDGTAAGALRFESSMGPVDIVPLGHASLRIEVGGSVIHIDPWSNVADYAEQPDADLVLITHDHPDHFDASALAEIVTDDTRVLADERSAAAYASRAQGLANGDSRTVDGVRVTAVPAYNLQRTRPDGSPYHPKGVYNGYLLAFGDLVVHVGGDTECVPELSELEDVDVSFLPINLPFTMPPEEAAACYRAMAPRVAVPYHQGDSDPNVVAVLLADTPIEVRVLPLP